MRRYSGPLWAPPSEPLVIAGLLQFLEKRAPLPPGGVELHLHPIEEVEELGGLELPLHVEPAEGVDLRLRGLAGRRARLGSVLGGGLTPLAARLGGAGIGARLGRGRRSGGGCALGASCLTRGL